MTKFEFEAICGELLIDVEVALEDYDIQNLLIDRSNTKRNEKIHGKKFLNLN